MCVMVSCSLPSISLCTRESIRHSCERRRIAFFTQRELFPSAAVVLVIAVVFRRFVGVCFGCFWLLAKQACTSSERHENKNTKTPKKNNTGKTFSLCVYIVSLRLEVNDGGGG